jgi:hypothetical protein
VRHLAKHILVAMAGCGMMTLQKWLATQMMSAAIKPVSCTLARAAIETGLIMPSMPLWPFLMTSAVSSMHVETLTI